MCCGNVLPIYSSCRLDFLEKFQEMLGDQYSDFDTLSNLEKTLYVLGSELWVHKDSAICSL